MRWFGVWDECHCSGGFVKHHNWWFEIIDSSSLGGTFHRISSPFHVGKKKAQHTSVRPSSPFIFAFPTWSTFNEQLCAVLPRNLTWNLKMMVWKMIFLFNWVIFRFHVKFQGCKQNPGLLSLHNRGLIIYDPEKRYGYFLFPQPFLLFGSRIQTKNQPGIMSNVSRGFWTLLNWRRPWKFHQWKNTQPEEKVMGPRPLISTRYESHNQPFFYQS